MADDNPACRTRDSTTSSTACTGSLTFARKFSYGVGHVLNDLCASMWFTYLLVFLHSILRFGNLMAGDLLLLGQVSDALATPFIGIESDRAGVSCRYGKRKTWHLVGTLCVACAFPFIFNKCISCIDAHDWAKFMYFAPFIIVFQFGWASTQVSHLSLIPELTPNEAERVELNAIRNSFTVVSNIFVYGLAWLLLDIANRDYNTMLTPNDSTKFQYLVLIVVGVGLLFSIIFHIGVREKPPQTRENMVAQIDSSTSIERSTAIEFMTWRCWLKQPQFYQIGLLYMSTRLVVNISQVYISMYVTETQKLDKQYIAIIPLVVFVSGFVASIMMRPINSWIGRKLTFLTGCLISIAACANFWFVPLGNEIYAAAILLGFGGNTMLVTSLSMTSDLINKNIETSAFVFGSMSFMDKLSNGIAVICIQKLHPCFGCCKECGWYFQRVMTFVPGSAAILALIMLLILAPQTIGNRRSQIRRLRPFTRHDDDGMVNNSASINGDIEDTKPLLVNGDVPTYGTSIQS